MPTTFRSRTPWRVKLEKAQEPKVVPVPIGMQKRLGTGTMLLPAPLEVDSVVRTVPRGRLVTVAAIRQKLASEHGADVTCPLVTGIFLRIVAEAAEEARRAKQADITPYWRVVRDDGSLMEKFPGGPAGQARYLRAEGHTILRGARKRLPKVKDAEKKFVELSTKEVVSQGNTIQDFVDKLRGKIASAAGSS